MYHHPNYVPSIFIYKSDCEVSKLQNKLNRTNLQQKGVENIQVLQIYLKKELHECIERKNQFQFS